jgi:hypothetical protein
MGSLFQQGGLTTPGSALIDPATKQPVYIGDPSKVRDINFKMSSQQHPYLPGTPNPNQPVPSIGQPSFEQAASMGGALSPGLNKAGKLMTLLSSGLQGALAGRQASEQMVAQTGGRRAGGVGTGFEGAFMLPWQRAAMMQDVAQKQAQTGLLQSEGQTYNIPGIGPIPGWLAKAEGPAWLRMQGQEQSAQTRAGAQTQSAQIGANARVQAAQVGQKYKAVPGVGLFDTDSKQIIPGSEGIVVTPDMAEKYGLPGETIGHPLGQVTPIASLQRSSVFQNVPLQTAEGPIVVNRRDATAQPVVGPGGQRYQPPALASPREVADLANPGQTKIVSGGTAIAQGAAGPGSASVATAKKAAASAVPTNIGNQTVAFNTAMQHADLLQQAVTALNNNDVKALNSLKNRFKTEFGSADVTNFQVIANAYTREITKMLSAGHMTNEEINQQGATIPANASPQQILGALKQYRALAQSKLNMLNQQKNAAVNAAQPNPPVNTNAAPTFAQWKASQNKP